MKLSAEQKALFSPGGIAPDAFTTSEMNLYRYCGNDPVDLSDPLGLIPPAPGLVDVTKDGLIAQFEAGGTDRGQSSGLTGQRRIG